MAEMQLTLSDQERAYLAQLLETQLKERQVEEHRTRAPSYREHVLSEEKLISGLLLRLGHAPK
jgi:hypothetical protein